MSEKHTPGPWEPGVEDAYLMDVVKQSVPPFREVARIGDDECSEADASLIAAAPEMLAMLKEAREELMQLASECEHFASQCQFAPPTPIKKGSLYLAGKMAKLIAKAEGRE